MTKAQQAQTIYSQQLANGSDRQAIVSLFISQLNMTPAGAATYYANCKRNHEGGEVARSSRTPTVSAAAVQTAPSDKMYTLCRIECDVVVSTGSFFDRLLALKHRTHDDILVTGLPEIGAPVKDILHTIVG